MAISSEVQPRGGPLNSLPVEFHWRTGSIHFERAVRTDSVRAVEDPVLPGGEAAEDASLQRLLRPKSQVCFKPCQGIGRLRRTRLDGLADFIFPVEIIRCGGNQACVQRLVSGKLLSN